MIIEYIIYFFQIDGCGSEYVVEFDSIMLKSCMTTDKDNFTTLSAFFHLSYRSSTSSGKPTEREKVVMQFDQDQLYSLYDKLEQIQSHLDALR